MVWVRGNFFEFPHLTAQSQKNFQNFPHIRTCGRVMACADMCACAEMLITTFYQFYCFINFIKKLFENLKIAKKSLKFAKII